MSSKAHYRPARILRAFSGKAVLVAVSALGVLLSGSLFLRITEKARAISIELPENPLSPPQRAPETVRMVSLNLSHGRGVEVSDPGRGRVNSAELRDRLQRIGESFGTMGLDLIALQEVDFGSWHSGGMDQAEVVARAAGFPYVVRQRNVDAGIPVFRRKAHGNALLSRFPIVEAEKIEFAPFSNWEKARMGAPGGLLAVVRLGEDRDIRVLVTQLDPRSEEIRVRAAGEIVSRQRASRMPMLVAGTLHSTPPGFPMSQTTSGGQNAIELLESFGGFQRRPARGQATWHDFTYPVSGPRRIIDWILPDRSWTVQQYDVLRDMQDSRHFPVMATFRIR